MRIRAWVRLLCRGQPVLVSLLQILCIGSVVLLYSNWKTMPRYTSVVDESDPVFIECRNLRSLWACMEGFLVVYRRPPGSPAPDDEARHVRELRDKLAKVPRVAMAVAYYGETLDFVRPAPGESEPSVRAVFMVKPWLRKKSIDKDQLWVVGSVIRGMEKVVAASPLAENTSLIGEVKNMMVQERMLHRDLKVTSTLAVVLVFGVLVWFLRSPWLAVLCFVPLAAALGTALCINLWVFGSLSALVLAFPPILIGIGIDYSIHLVNTGARLRRQGRSPEAVLLRLYHEQLRPVTLGALTTACAFGSLALGTMRGLQEVALLGAGGILLCLLYVLLFLPVMLFASHGMRVAPRPFRPRPLGFRWAVVVAALTLGGLGCMAAVRLRYDTSPRTVRNPEEKAFQYYDALSRELGVMPEPIIVAATSLRQYRAARAAVPAHFTGEDGGFRPALSLPFARKAIPFEGLSTLVRHTPAFMRRALGLDFVLDAEVVDTWLRLRVRHPKTGGERDLWLTGLYPREDPLDERRLEALAVAAAKVRQETGGAVVTGLPIYYHHLLKILKKDAARIGVVALAGAIIVLWIGFRSISAAAASLVPSACALIWLLGIMAVAGMPLNLLNVTAIPLVVGLGVDDGVHLIHRRLLGRTGRTVIRHIAGAVLLTTVTTVAGFLSLSPAQNPALRSMGYVGAIGLVAAMVLTLWVLPAIAEKIVRPRAASASVPLRFLAE